MDSEKKPRSISEMSFGMSDGKNEARQANFESLFYNGGGYYNKLKNDSLKFLVIGRKGTGKTILVRYFRKQLSKENNTFTKFIVAGDFTNEKLNTFDYVSVREEEREIFWRYVILKELASLVLNEEKGFLSRKWISKLRELDQELTFNLEELIQENEDSFKAGLNSKGPTAEAGDRSKKVSKYKPASYFAKVQKLTNILMDVMKRSKRRYFLFFDDLDEIKLSSIQNTEGEDNVTTLAKLLNDFVSALSYINDKLLDLESGSRVISTLRQDVVKQMQFYGNNINKVVTDNGIKITWFSPMITRTPQNTELGKLVIHKIKASVADYQTLDDKKLFDIIFPRTRGKSNPFKFIVDRGFGRPRDVIRYLDIVQEKFPDSQSINYNLVHQVQGEYCSWFYSELQNEINILENSQSIVESLNLIKKNGNIIFSFDEVSEMLEQNFNDFSDIKDLKSDLKSLFVLGAIGNYERKDDKKAPIIEYSYRDGTDNPDFSKKFKVHPALRNYLSMG